MAQQTKVTSNGDGAGEVFRQFAWHLAGSLAKPGSKASARPQRTEKR